jgi:phosphoribosylformylglycinamidine synthase subunit PurS
MRVTVTILRRPEIADPEGTTVRRALHDLNFTEVADVRMNRVITLEVEGDDLDVVRGRVDDMCRRLLANPVMEDYHIEVEG